MGEKFPHYIFKTTKAFHEILLGFLILCVACYQKYLSSLFSVGCKYYPTCSEFTKQSLKKHGIIRGGFFSVIRIIKCNPFSSGGIDLVK